MFDSQPFIHPRSSAIDASGIRRVFDLAATLENPVNLSIGQPDFDVPDAIKDAAIKAISGGQNRYTQTQGIADLRQRIVAQLKSEFPHTVGAGAGAELRDDLELLITSGVSGGLMLALLCCVGPGDEVLIPDPYFVMYKHLVTLAGATAVFVDTYPDFELTAQRIEPLITPQTKMILCNWPSNPTGVVASEDNCREITDLAARHNLLLLNDEIYDQFYYGSQGTSDVQANCPSPATFGCDLLLMRGFSKSYAMTGWRLGYAVGPRPIIEQMTKLQQYSFVCAPSMVQQAGIAALDVDITSHVQAYKHKRDRVVEKLAGHYELTMPGGAFYAFPEVPSHLGQTASEFVERAIKENLLIIPGSVFSQRDTHFRLSYACDEKMLDMGLDILIDLAQR
jgi:aspartate/methionine/tyrosine aminotransferase